MFQGIQVNRKSKEYGQNTHTIGRMTAAYPFKWENRLAQARLLPPPVADPGFPVGGAWTS